MKNAFNSRSLGRLRFDNELTAFQSLMPLLSPSTENMAAGSKVIAKSPLSPAEPLLAAGALAYDLYTGENFAQSLINENQDLARCAVDAGLSPDFNPWNMIMTASMTTGACKIPVEALVVACSCWDDQLKKGSQIMADATGIPAYFWEIPRFDPDSEPWALEFLEKELKHLIYWLSFQTGNRVDNESLIQAIKQVNLIRTDLLEINQTLESENIAMPALEYYISQLFLAEALQDKSQLHRHFQLLISELRDRERAGRATSPQKPLRVYLMGDETQQLSLFNSLEDNGGMLVGCDARLSFYYELVKEEGSAIKNLARWIWRMPCNMPAYERIMATIPFIKKQSPDAVIINSTAGSRNLPGSERMARDLVKKHLEVPVLTIETSLPGQDIEKVDYLIRAFIEMHAY